MNTLQCNEAAIQAAMESFTRTHEVEQVVDIEEEVHLDASSRAYLRELSGLETQLYAISGRPKTPRRPRVKLHPDVYVRCYLGWADAHSGVGPQLLRALL